MDTFNGMLPAMYEPTNITKTNKSKTTVPSIFENTCKLLLLINTY